MKLIQQTAIILAALLLTTLPSCKSNFWSSEECALIDSAAYSRMRVTTIDSPCDSLLLRSKCRPLTKEALLTPHFGRLAASMIETVNNPENEGVGIAAPQVGVLVRMVAVQRFDKSGEPFEIYVNPEIVERSDSLVVSSEGCLSVPNHRGEIMRSARILLNYRNGVTFEPQSEWIDGFTAIIFQHEIDHLDGIIYTDHLSE